MLDSVKITDSSVELATKRALQQLNLEQDQVKVEVLVEPKKGLFGFGKKDATVLVTPKVETLMKEIKEEVPVIEADSDDVEEQEEILSVEMISETNEKNMAIQATTEYLKEVCRVYGAEATVLVKEEEDCLLFCLESDKPGLLIGKHGKILNALQNLAQVMVHRYVSGRMTVLVDVGDYREKRQAVLKQIADRTASKVLRTKQPVFLEPLPAYERKQIHAYISKDERLKTHSEGKEPHRYLVVEFAKS